MIVIYTDRDLDVLTAEGDVSVESMRPELRDAAADAEDVYFWIAGEAFALKRRNAPLCIPEWLQEAEDVDL